MIGHAIGKKLSAKEAKKILLITGMAAGFAALSNANRGNFALLLKF